MDSKTTKSLEELEALAKSAATEPVDDKDKAPAEQTEPDPAPDTIVENHETVDEDSPDEDKDNMEKSKTAKSGDICPDCGKPMDKCTCPNGDNLAKCDNPEAATTMAKSMLMSDPDIAQAVQSTEFQAAVVATVSDALGHMAAASAQFMKSMAERMTALEAAHARSTSAMLELAKSMTATQTLVKSMPHAQPAQPAAPDYSGAFESLTKSMENLNATMSGLGADMATMANQTPYVRKSLSGMQVQDRNFQASLNGSTAKPTLEKSKVLAILENAVYTGNPIVSVSDVVGFESGAPLSPQVQAYVESQAKS